MNDDINKIKSKNEYSYDSTSNKGITISTSNETANSTLFENSYLSQDYFHALPNNINIFSKAKKNLDKISNPGVEKFTIKFIHLFERLLIDTVNKMKTSNYLPPMPMKPEEDGSVFFEWIFKDFRIGFSIEVNIEESYWYLITNKNLEEFNVSGELKANELNFTISKIIKYVVENT
jgi:hypothetical protein